MGTENVWWQYAVFYQVYPRSFADSNGDGIGDLRGVIAHLDYLTRLGVDALWLSPVFASPMSDFGYDITDHRGIDPIFGDLDTFDELVAEAHHRGLRVVLDYVPNHTSRKHPWFMDALRGPDSPYRDWYWWLDPGAGGTSSNNGTPPNNWRRNGHIDVPGSAWTFDPHSGQYYLATFSSDQPDLNWTNPTVRAAMHDVLRFWLDRDVDGFRIDMLDFLGKDPELRDEIPLEVGKHYFSHARRQLYLPRTLDYLREMSDLIHAYPDRVMIGELAYLTPIPDLVSFYGTAETLVDLPFNFRLIMLAVEATPIAEFVDAYDRAVSDASAPHRRTPAWPTYCVGNHDNPRIGRHGEPVARLAAMLLLTLRGTPFLYYGDEIGMPDVTIPPHQRRDPHPTLENPGGRDSARTPMQWDSGPFAGFSSQEPWLPVDPDHTERNVVAQQADRRSILALYQNLLSLRRERSALHAGSYHRLDELCGNDLFVFERRHDDDRAIVALNFGQTHQTVLIPHDRSADIILSTHLDRNSGNDRRLSLRPHEGVVLGSR